MKFFASLLAIRSPTAHHSVIAFEANTQDEADGRAMRICKKSCYPLKDGWTLHHVVVIPENTVPLNPDEDIKFPTY